MGVHVSFDLRLSLSVDIFPHSSVEENVSVGATVLKSMTMVVSVIQIQTAQGEIIRPEPPGDLTNMKKFH